MNQLISDMEKGIINILNNNQRGTEIAAALTEAGLEDTTAHFLPRRQIWGRERWMWSMVREGKVVW